MKVDFSKHELMQMYLGASILASDLSCALINDDYKTEEKKVEARQELKHAEELVQKIYTAMYTYKEVED